MAIVTPVCESSIDDGERAWRRARWHGANALVGLSFWIE
jgi:hypothetical protein